MTNPDISITIAGVKLNNPVMVASGTFGYGDEYSPLVDIDQIGAVVSKTLTIKPRPGHPPIRTFETPAGMINAIGLANIGIDRFIQEKMPFLRSKQCACVVNIAGQTIEEYAEAASKFNHVPGIHMMEINISSPNVKKGCMEFGSSPQLTYECIQAIKQATKIPVMAKLSPNVTRITDIALAAEEAGADCLSLINTIVGMAIDIKKKRPVLSNITGGLSGPAIRPVGVAMTWKVFQKVKIPIVGMGGIMNLQDALEYIFAGASAIQVGTANYVDPNTSVKIVAGLKNYLQENNICCFKELIGIAHRQ